MASEPSKAQALSADEKLASHTRESLASLAHDTLLDVAVALATRCRELEVTRVGKPYIYTLPDELLLSRILLALPVISRFRCCAVSRRFKTLLFTPALREELHAAVDPMHVLLSGRSLTPDLRLRSPDRRFFLVYQGDANLVLYYDFDASGIHFVPVWALQTVGCPYARYRAHCLELSRDGVVAVVNYFNQRYWQSPAPNGQPPYRLVVRNQGDFAVLDCNDAVVWAAVPPARPWEA